MLQKLLSHPLTRGMDLDDPQTTNLRKEIIQQKPFLIQLYQEWYSGIVNKLPEIPGTILELGSGAGFLDQYLPGLITSEVFFTPLVKAVVDSLTLPFPEAALKAIVMVDVLHHIPDVRTFFHQATRCVRPGGRVIVVEPWVSGWSRLIFTRLHHEPFKPDAGQWEFKGSGPVSSANGALPWIIFRRDREIFERDFPDWTIISIQPDMPLVYLFSGGVSMRSLMPGWTYRLWRGFEHRLSPWMDRLAMFAQITLQRK